MGYTYIPGLASRYPTKEVYLPLRYPNSIKPDDDDAIRTNYVMGGVIANKSSVEQLIGGIQYGLQSDMKTIALLPLVDACMMSNLKFQKLEIHLPRAVLKAPTLHVYGCYSGPEDELCIVIDIIDQDFLFITLTIILNDFIVGDSNDNLHVDNFERWLHISVPYSFELRSEPLAIKALNQNNLIVSLLDGGLLHFKRNLVLADVEIYNFTKFTPTTKGVIGSIFSGTENRSHKKSVGQVCCLDIESIDDRKFLAFSSDQSLSMYDIELHRPLKQIYLSEKYNGINELTTLLHGYVNSVGTTSTTPRLVFVLASFPSLQVKGIGRDALLIMALDFPDDSDIIYNEKYSFEASRPTFFTDTLHTNGVLYVQDYAVSQEEKSFLHRILWRCNNSTVLSCYLQDVHSGVITSVAESKAEMDSTSLFTRVTDRNDASIIRRIWDSGRYDSSMILCAIHLFCKSLSVGTIDLLRPNLRSTFCSAIASVSISAGISSTSLWNKFFLICEELRKNSQEPLSFNVMPRRGIMVQANGIGIFRDLHFLEDISFHPASGSLTGIFKILRVKVSSSAASLLKKFMETIQFFDEDSISKKAQELLNGKFNDYEVGMLIEKLDDTVLNLIRDVTKVPDINPPIVPDVNGSRVGVFLRLFAMNTFRAIIDSHRAVLLELASLFMLCEMDEKVMQILESIRQHFSSYKFIEQVFEVCFTDTNSVVLEKDTLGRPEMSIFWKIFSDEETLMSYLHEFDLNGAFDVVRGAILCNDYGIYTCRLIISLIDCGEYNLAKEQFKVYLDVRDPCQRLVNGLLCLFTGDLEEFREILSNYTHVSSAQTSNAFRKIHPALVLLPIFKNLFDDTDSQILQSLYFHELSLLCEKCSSFSEKCKEKVTQLLGEAMFFEKEAIRVHCSTGLLDNVPLKYHRRVVDLSIKMKHFEEAFESLPSMLPYIDSFELKGIFAILLKALIENGNQRLLFGRLSDLIAGQRHLIDAVLMENANNDLVLWRSLKTYELLFSWRLFGEYGAIGDRRGASEALYIFITRFRLESERLKDTPKADEDYRRFKLKILELYMIIINCLKSFKKDDDRWLRKKENGAFQVIDIQSLMLEYLDWLQELEKDAK